MTKQDMIRSLKKDLRDLKVFFLVAVLLVTFFSALVGAYKGCILISSAVSKAFEPTAEEIEAEAKAKAKQELLNELILNCERRCPVGMHARARYGFCYDQAIEKMKKK